MRDYPEIEIEELRPIFPKLDHMMHPILAKYTWEDCHRDFAGSGGLMLVAEMAERVGLQPGMNVLDLACGRAKSSLFLAKHYGVHVVAADLFRDPTENWERVKAAGLRELVTPISLDARNIPYPHGYFDAVICLNSFFYFGTDDQYLSYLAQFLRLGGRLCIASPCYSDELTADTPSEYLYDAPEYQESRLVHSPGWWRDHFLKSGEFNLLICEDHPLGRELWLDDVRFCLEEKHPRNMSEAMRSMIKQEIGMLLADEHRFVTYLFALAERR